MKWILLATVLLFPIISKADNHSIFFGGFTLHGYPNSNGVWEGMPRRVDDKGQLVITPTIGYRYESDFIYTASILKDCYDNFASTLLVGRRFYSNDFLNLEWSLGLYIREKPYYTDSSGQRLLARDKIPYIEQGSFQIVPIGFVGIELFKDWKVRPVFNTNLFITNLSFKYDF